MALLAEQLGLKARALRLEPQHLAELKLPAVLHWDMNHFVVLKSVGRRTFVIHDPARGVLRMSAGQVADGPFRADGRGGSGRRPGDVGLRRAGLSAPGRDCDAGRSAPDRYDPAEHLLLR